MAIKSLSIRIDEEMLNKLGLRGAFCKQPDTCTYP